MRILVALIMLSLLGGCVTEKAFPEADVKPPEERSGLHADLAANYLQRGQLDIAIEEVEKALDLDRNNKSANYIMALVQIRLKKRDKAEPYFKKAIKGPDPLTSAQHDYANFLCRDGEYKKAEDLYRGLLGNVLYKSQARLLSNVGSCFYKQDKYTEAENAMRQSLRLNPNSPDALLQMSKISFNNGKPLETRGWYSRYFQIGAKGGPEILYIAYKTEKTLGDKNASATYALKLRSRYPASSQAKKLRQH
ncbi:MAG: type IV pilus biogenesis/stability protein PilW [Gammaproteobacteria bacterium]|nr:type IV pilus biogenesis/stability protein PilW [Gammaproteobacteria bacterium]